MKLLTGCSDQELIHMYMDGDAAAMSALIARHQSKIYTSIYMMLKDRFLADDFFQDTFIKIIETIRNKKYMDDGRFLPWAMRIAHNLCIDHYRKTKRSPTIVDSDNVDISTWVSFSEPPADYRIIKQQTYKTLAKMLDKLPQDQKEVIVLRSYAGLSFKEIASITDASLNTTLGRMRYGLINMRKMVNKYQLAL
jgi:RNA polymerase sigma factor (sigma-70 family)